MVDDPVLRIAEQKSPGDDPGRPVAVPLSGPERVEFVEPAALDARIQPSSVEKPTAVHIAAIAVGERHRQPPQLPAGAERDGTVRSQQGVRVVRRPAAARACDDHVPVVRRGGTRVLDHGRTALDDVVEGVLPDDPAGLEIDLVQLAVVGAPEQVQSALVAHDDGLPRPAAAGPGLVLALGDRRSHPPADIRSPDERERRGRRAEAVDPARLVSEERGELDAVTLRDDGGRRVDLDRLGQGREQDSGDDCGRRRGGRLIVRRAEPGEAPCVPRPVAGDEHAAGHRAAADRHEQRDEKDTPPSAPTPAASLHGALADVDPVGRLAARTLVPAHDARSVPSPRACGDS